MFKTLSVITSLAVFLVAGLANAADKKETVVEMMNKAISHFEAVGPEQAYKDFAVKDTDYNHGEFYIFVTSMKDGSLTFHGANPKLMGKKLGKLKDTDGKLFVLEFREVANGPGEGWVDYKWPHAVTKKITPKHTYIKKTGDHYFGIGYSD